MNCQKWRNTGIQYGTIGTFFAPFDSAGDNPLLPLMMRVESAMTINDRNICDRAAGVLQVSGTRKKGAISIRKACARRRKNGLRRKGEHTGMKACFISLLELFTPKKKLLAETMMRRQVVETGILRLDSETEITNEKPWKLKEFD